MPNDTRLEAAASRSGLTLEPLDIDLLGRFEVCIGARSIPGADWRLRKAKSLLQLLALSPGHRIHRERVLELLWPEDYEDHRDNAANTLNRVLHALRHILQPDAPPRHVSDYIALSGDVLILCPQGNLRVDVDAFKEAAFGARRTLDPQAVTRALDLYRGELLPHETDEEWLADYRTDVHERYTALLADAVRMHLRQRDRDGAKAYLQMLVAAQPDDEQACVALMYLYAASHRRFAALLLYQRLRKNLRELGVEPESAAQQLYAQIQRDQQPLPMPEAGYDLGAVLDDTHTHTHTRTDMRPPASTSSARLVVPSAVVPSDVEDMERAASASSFVGREPEVVEVTRLLEHQRLVTLTGPGGAGKSRLAREVVSHIHARDGVVVVELAALSDARLAPNVVAAAVGVSEEAGRPLVETLARALRAKELVLLLDNCEHLRDACKALALALLAACPELRVLATSRRCLDVKGERVFVVPPLAVPAPEQLPPFDELLTYDAVRLFCERAAASAPSFTLTAENAAAVVAICARLDGIPLALELAARRRGHMATEQLARRLDDALDMLEGAGVQGSGRNQTLRATLDWSYNLLAEPEHTLFRRLAVFRGSWTLEAAEALTEAHAQAFAEMEQTSRAEGSEADPSGTRGIIRQLGRLVDDSLVQVEGSGEKIRYRYLEPVRQYAQAKLVASGEAERLRAVHAEWCSQLAGEGDAPFRAMSQDAQAQWLQTMDAELANLRAALDWARTHGHAEIGLRLAVALEPYWYRRGMLREGSDWLEELLALPDSQQARLRPAAMYSASVFALQRADLRQARRLASEGVALCRERGDTLGTLRTLTVLGGAAELAGDYAEATTYYEQCLQLARQIGDIPREIVSLSNLADAAIAWGDVERAAELYQRCLTLARSEGRARLIGMALTNVGKIALRRGQMDEAAQFLHEGLLHMRGLQEARGIAEVLVPLGHLALLRGNVREALARTVEAFERYFHAGMQPGIAQSLEALARIAIAVEAWEWAAQLLSAAGALRERAGLPCSVAERREVEQGLQAVQRHVAGEDFAIACARGRTRPLGELVAEAAQRARAWPPTSDEHVKLTAKTGAETGGAPASPSASIPKTLTARQREVADLVALGLTNSEIAVRLSVDRRTVETHVANIYSRMRVHSRGELRKALREHRTATVSADTR